MLATTQEFPLHLRAIQSQLQQPNSPLQDLIGFESQDFESLYVEIPTTAAHERLPQCVSLAFKHQAIKAGMKNSAAPNLIFVPSRGKSAYWATDRRDDADGDYLTPALMMELIHYILDNIYVAFGGRVYRQILGLPMGINCGVEFAVGFLASYELPFLVRQLQLFSDSLSRTARGHGRTHTVQALSQPLPPLLPGLFYFIRYVDDLFYGLLRGFAFADYLYDERDNGGHDGIYPREFIGPRGRIITMPLSVKVSSTGTEVNFLDVTVMLSRSERTDGVHSLHYKLYDKRRDNPRFAHTNQFPPMNSILADPSKYSVLRAQMFRFDRNCSFATDFVENTISLATEMIQAGYNKRRLVTEIRKFGSQWRKTSKSKGKWVHVMRKILSSLNARVIALRTCTHRGN